MGEVLGVGLTHFPPLGWPDDAMDRALQFGFADPSVPDAVRQGEGWPEGMRDEFDRTASRSRRSTGPRSCTGATRSRAALDDFAPDVVVIWGDDQYELFREDIVPAFCVIASDALGFSPWRNRRATRCRTSGTRTRHPFELRGHLEFGRAPRDVAAARRHRRRLRVLARATDRPFPHAFSTPCCSSTTTGAASPMPSSR